MQIGLSLSFCEESGEGQSRRLQLCQPLLLTEVAAGGVDFGLPLASVEAAVLVFCLGFGTCRAVKGKRGRKAGRHCAICALVTTFLQLNYLTLEWL